MPGGIERAIVNTANLFTEKGHRITLLVLEPSGQSFFDLSPKVKTVVEPLPFGIYEGGNLLNRKLDLWKDVKSLRRLLKDIRPHVVIATEYNYAIALVLAYGGKGIPLFSWEHHHFTHLKKNRFWRFLQKRLYPKLSAVICLNPAEADYYSSLGCRAVVIPNFCGRGERSSLQEKNILTVGWLSKTKGMDFIPAIAKKIFQRFPDWQWTIIGTGDEEAALKEQLQKENLHQVKILRPQTNDLSSAYIQSSLYVMTSRFECFPMVLLEAMSHGVSCVSFDCPTGPQFIINHGVDGLLVKRNDVDAMAEAITDLMQSEERRRLFSDAAYENIARFSREKIYRLWERLLT